jgi:dienelactone hydrolase
MLPLQEKEFALTTPDNKKIYGVLTQSPIDTRKLMILSHGLTGHMGEHMHMEAKRFFSNNGYDVVRFNYYGPEDDARKLEETTLALHAQDLNHVCDHFRANYDKLFIAGHSYGGLTLVIANPQATALSFWDSSFTPFKGFVEREAKKLEGTPYYTIGWGKSVLISAAMYEEAREMDSKADALAKLIPTPSQVILAGDNSENPVRMALYEALTCPSQFEDIDRADHCFTHGDTLSLLFKHTLSWFEQF